MKGLIDSCVRTAVQDSAPSRGSRGRRWFDIAASIVGLACFAPFLVAAAAAIWLEDGFPVFFIQSRIGRNGLPFGLAKLRTMCTGVIGSQITSAADSRITRVGTLLRMHKLDEIPQLWNVLRGEMSLVGPRPEVPCYVNADDPVWRVVLSCAPGITDLATLLYRDEEQILAEADDPERYYREVILPSKLALNMQYLAKRTLFLDLKLILLTIRYSFWRTGFDPATVRQAFL